MPVIGLVRVGSVVTADRFAYLPQIGLCIAVAWSAAALTRSRCALLPVLAAVAAAVLAGLAVRMAADIPLARLRNALDASLGVHVAELHRKRQPRASFCRPSRVRQGH